MRLILNHIGIIGKGQIVGTCTIGMCTVAIVCRLLQRSSVVCAAYGFREDRGSVLCDTAQRATKRWCCAVQRRGTVQRATAPQVYWYAIRAMPKMPTVLRGRLLAACARIRALFPLRRRAT